MEREQEQKKEGMVTCNGRMMIGRMEALQCIVVAAVKFYSLLLYLCGVLMY